MSNRIRKIASIAVAIAVFVLSWYYIGYYLQGERIALASVSVNVVDTCGSGKSDMVRQFSEWLMEKYKNMTGEYPALCPGFYVELAKLPNSYAGFAHFANSGGRVCVSKIQIACDLNEFETKETLAHEFGHAMQATFVRDINSFRGWIVEAVPEAAATHIMSQILQVPWYGFYFTRSFYTERLYQKNPWNCEQGSTNYCEYKYSGAVGWLFERYGYRRIFEQWSYPNVSFIKESYVAFLLTPWSWPYKPEFSFLTVCHDSVDAYSGAYCYDDREYLFEPGELVLISNSAYANATFQNKTLLMAFVHTAKLDSLDATVTVRPCKNVTTITVPVTTTVTTTTTIPVTTTLTTTTTLPVTTTITLTTTTTQTVTVTNISTTTVTKTTTVPVTVTETKTVTTTTTIPVTVTATETVAKNTTITVTETKTEISTTTVPVTITETKTVATNITTTVTLTTTETVVKPSEVDWVTVAILLAIVVVLILLACLLARGRISSL